MTHTVSSFHIRYTAFGDIHDHAFFSCCTVLKSMYTASPSNRHPPMTNVDVVRGRDTPASGLTLCPFLLLCCTGFLTVASPYSRFVLHSFTTAAVLVSN